MPQTRGDVHVPPGSRRRATAYAGVVQAAIEFLWAFDGGAWPNDAISLFAVTHDYQDSPRAGITQSVARTLIGSQSDSFDLQAVRPPHRIDPDIIHSVARKAARVWRTQMRWRRPIADPPACVQVRA
jgi:hypothetical protein